MKLPEDIHVNDLELKTCENYINNFGHIVLKIQISSSNFNHFRRKLDEIKTQLVSLSSTGCNGKMTKTGVATREHFLILIFCWSKLTNMPE